MSKEVAPHHLVVHVFVQAALHLLQTFLPNHAPVVLVNHVYQAHVLNHPHHLPVHLQYHQVVPAFFLHHHQYHLQVLHHLIAAVASLCHVLAHPQVHQVFQVFIQVQVVLLYPLQMYPPHLLDQALLIFLQVLQAHRVHHPCHQQQVQVF